MFRKRRAYLDFAAGALGNPSSPHKEGRVARAKLDEAREGIARLIECKDDDVIFTSGATESNALAILGLAKPGAHILYLPSAHASIVENARIAQERGARISALPIQNARVDVERLEALLTPETALVSMDAVCGETGVVWNTREVRQALPNTVRLHVDASQAPYTEKLERSHYGADLLVFDGGKLGVRGIGCLIASRTIPLIPLYGGGGQERGLRSGTENVEAAAAFASALADAAGKRDGFTARAGRMRAELVRALAGIPALVVNEGRAQAPNILSLSLPGRDTDYLVALLDEAGYAASTRSACETDSEEGSRAVFALTGDPERAKSTLRISWGPLAKARDLEQFAEALAREVAFVDTREAS